MRLNSYRRGPVRAGGVVVVDCAAFQRSRERRNHGCNQLSKLRLSRETGSGSAGRGESVDVEQYARVRETALRLLARREHSTLELRRKLLLREYPESLVDQVIAELAAEKLLSDERFAEEFVRSRREKGYGPRRIQAELYQHGIDPTVAESLLREAEEDWQARALAQYR